MKKTYSTTNALQPTLKHSTTLWLVMLALLMLVTGGSVSAQSFAIVGTGTASNTSTGYPAPYGRYYYGARHQFLVTAAQLTAAGIPAGATISSLGFNVTATNSAGAHTGFQVKVFTTTNANPIGSGWLTSGQVAQTTAVNYTPVTGWNQHSFKQRLPGMGRQIW